MISQMKPPTINAPQTPRNSGMKRSGTWLLTNELRLPRGTQKSAYSQLMPYVKGITTNAMQQRKNASSAKEAIGSIEAFVIARVVSQQKAGHTRRDQIQNLAH